MVGTVNPYWQNYIDGVYYSNSATKSYFTSILGVLDSGTSILCGPASFINPILTTILKGVTTTTASSSTTFSCSTYKASMPIIYIRFGNYWLSMLPQDYIY